MKSNDIAELLLAIMILAIILFGMLALCGVR